MRCVSQGSCPLIPILPLTYSQHLRLTIIKKPCLCIFQGHRHQQITSDRVRKNPQSQQRRRLSASLSMHFRGRRIQCQRESLFAFIARARDRFPRKRARMSSLQCAGTPRYGLFDFFESNGWDGWVYIRSWRAQVSRMVICFGRWLS